MGVKENFPKLSYFFGCYLYQCALEEYGSIEGAVTEFIASEEPESIRALSVECDAALQIAPTRQMLLDLGSCYAPKADDETSIWLARAQTILQNHLAGT
jgi:hypothetical protein